MIIREMNPNDWSKVISLWQNTEGIGIGRSDTKEGLEKFLNRNKGMSFVCEIDGKIIATIMCGHDGRRGFIYHLTVAENFRLQGIGKRLVEKALEELKNQGIHKCHIFVMKNNEKGKNFWSKMGFQKRDDIEVFSIDI
ncbi:ribosomal protein S18 acetylase RimI-like enzyme [Caldicellulosiruptor bescii]|uniref:GCN5-related N-acetyltransferase n=2 Tax=Caldicellulosiruptor bescii TaxID=31899 RepID=B9MM48_CALBD|nr:GNAT family N-acetyltransferase [Caldicellulosiruptor bescii]ACM61271.1 GCN5-related N-acetyltransferase [Caldicellulosiruptor bescii DSM 6725]PBC88916.1 ribosomal protein S18 acetylase RimI-like enzyme [Caldicellulosiruptor bescii]PBC91602.1 ribosomal protein S18 acetylase RimI-like enzyme [Caldicellulosiruptor bescii]PBD02985.1 ribosomal protein S18 acetylase RimI-like enzyme [Caldicellulosiruptor bescii]PBD07399.1 ribosomal protein S18 acetylase RimI-like enzyme [Caldicellulosiruptor bes